MSEIAARGRRYPVGIAIGVLATVVAAVLFGPVVTRHGAGATKRHPVAVKPTRLVYATPFGHSKVAREAVYSTTPSNRGRIRLAVGSTPLISPNGRWVAYDAGPQNSHTGLSLIAATGGAARHAGTAGYPVAWSPDSRLVAVVHDNGYQTVITVVNARTLRATTLAVPSGRNFGFSPDGRTLIFDHDESTARSDLYTVTLATGAVHRLTHDGRSWEPLWGPREIAFNRYSARGSGDVWLMRANGTDAHRLMHTNLGLYPAGWSADGSRLLVAKPDMFNGRLYAVDPATGATRALTPLLGGLIPQGLSTDGRTVLAAYGCPNNPAGSGVLETIPFAGGPPTVVARGACGGSWNA
ncbi:MAG TPA: hypothetical protein VFW14_15240 [Gaiellales bacterium]|nr:hypothetical protein [Gaiellales bacterium]